MLDSAHPQANLSQEDALATAVDVRESKAARSALRKASLRLLPLIGLGYGIAYIDRVNISFAALQMNHDLGFSATTYGLGAGLFFLTYATLEVPSNLLLARFGARRWLARIMLTWGLISMAMVLVRVPWQFYALRLLLGAAEAGFFPGVIFYLTHWFPQSHRCRAVSRFYISLPLSSVVMGMIAGTLLNLQGKLGLAGWQWLFLLEGIPAVLIGAAFFTMLPDVPAEAKWLTAEERGALEALLEPTDAGATMHGMSAVKAALGDGRVWLLGLFLFGTMISCYGYIFVAPSLLQQVTGWSVAWVGYLIAGIGVLTAVSMLLNGSHSDRSGEKFWHILAPTLVMLAGFLAVGLLHNAAVIVVAAACIVIASASLQVPFVTIAPSFLRGKTAAAGIAAVNSIALCGGFVGPYWMGRAIDLTGNYQRGMLTLALPTLVSCGLLVVLRREMRRRERQSPPFKAVECGPVLVEAE
jgi:ACS family tartrate transporter-like MFS transporter